jgi:hypothetical protein
VRAVARRAGWEADPVETMIEALIVLLLALGLACGQTPPQPTAVAQAVNDVDPKAPVGERPYEMVEANRVEERAPLVDFEDLTGWTVEMYDGAEARLARSREQQMWGQHVAKLEYKGTQPSSRFIVRPPRPVPVADQFDCLNLWLHANRWSWVNPPDTPSVGVTALFTDAAGKPYSIYLTNTQWEEWWLVHRRLDAATLKAIQFPCQFTGLEFRGGSQPDWRQLYLDSLSFYTEILKPLQFAPRPKRNLTLFAGQPAGQNTGAGKLDFPTREQTILPSNFATGYKTTVTAKTKGVYSFAYDGPDAKLTYRVDLAQGFSGIEAFVNGQRVSQPMKEGGLRFGAEAPLTLKSAKLQEGVVTAQYEPGVTYRFRLWQKSLVIDVLCPGGKATEIAFGSYAGLHAPQTIYVPFMAWTNGPQVLMSRAGSDTGLPVFSTVYADWYRSNASELYVTVAQGQDTAKVNGGIRYHPKTDGQRNEVYDRIFLTVSPTFEEVLPTIANPRGRHAKEGAERLWRESWGPNDFAKEQEASIRRRAYGIEMLTQCNHEISWRDGGESFTMRLHAAPKKGGDEKQAWYVKAQQSLGWMSGLYTNYTDYAPVNSHWSEDWVARESNNEWRPAWPRNYNCKPTRANEVEHELAPRIKAKYGVNSSYTDVHTAVAPWAYNDYDARAPGAGTFAQTFYCYGELLRNDSRVYGGPIFSEGTYQMLYAGLTDGNYGHVYNGVNLAQQPYLPAYDLHKIHPLEADIGISWTSNYCDGIPNWRAPENLAHSLDRFLAAEMVYGHIGWLVEDEFGTGLQCRSYYLMQQLQTRYGCKAPKAIDYFDGTGYQSTSQAVASGKYRANRIRIQYPGGLRLWVNGNETEAWTVKDAGLPGKEAVLPPAGWVAVAPGFYEFSGLQQGRRVDLVRSPEYLYFDGRGSDESALGLTCRGAIAVRKRSATRLEVVDCADSREFGLQQPCGVKGAVLSAEAFDVAGKSLGKPEIRRTKAFDWVIGHPNAVRYEVDFGPAPPALGLKGDLGTAPPGGEVRISGPAATLTCEGAAVQGNAVHIPTDAKPGSRLWVKGEAAGQVGWVTVQVAPLVELSLQPGSVSFPQGTAQVTLSGRVTPPSPAVGEATLSVSAPAWLQVELGGTSVPLDFTKVLKLTLAGAPDTATAELAVTVQAGQLTQTIRFALNLAPGSVNVRRFDDPEWGFEWGQCARGQKEQPGDPKTGALFIRQPENVVGGVRKPGLFSHPCYNGGAGYSFATFAPVQLPPQPAELHLFIGLGDGGDPSDGVDYSMVATDARGQETKLFAAHGDQRVWREVTADLSALAGQTVRFRLVCDCGAKDNTVADWACWGDPAIRLKQPVPELAFAKQ